MDETGSSITRWRRFGKDRLYVRSAEDQDLGWWDLLTDEAHPIEPAVLGEVTRAVGAWRAERSLVGDASAGPVTPVAAPEHPASVGVRPWIDLAGNRPGEGARELADSAFIAAPVRSSLARLVGVHTEERAWRIGADGEERVAAQLAKVVKKDPRWRMLHSVPVGTRGADIDHVVIGPGGVFTINAKHHPGADIWVGGETFLVDGHKQPYVRNARHEAERAGRLLSSACSLDVHVQGVIATVNARDIVVKAQPSGVSVLARMQIAKWLMRHGATLDDATCDVVYEAARRSTTWTG